MRARSTRGIVPTNEARVERNVPDLHALMLEARADLGDNRITSLPLEGHRVPDWMKAPKISLNELDDKRLAWHTKLIDPSATPARNDGIGAGDSHRYGANYRPDSLLECNYCRENGHVMKDCARYLAQVKAKPTVGKSGRLSVPPNSYRSDTATSIIGIGKAAFGFSSALKERANNYYIPTASPSLSPLTSTSIPRSQVKPFAKSHEALDEAKQFMAMATRSSGRKKHHKHKKTTVSDVSRPHQSINSVKFKHALPKQVDWSDTAASLAPKIVTMNQNPVRQSVMPTPSARQSRGPAVTASHLVLCEEPFWFKKPSSQAQATHVVPDKRSNMVQASNLATAVSSSIDERNRPASLDHVSHLNLKYTGNSDGDVDSNGDNSVSQGCQLLKQSSLVRVTSPQKSRDQAPHAFSFGDDSDTSIGTLYSEAGLTIRQRATPVPSATATVATESTARTAQDLLNELQFDGLRIIESDDEEFYDAMFEDFLEPTDTPSSTMP